jgi:hypothetical protein
MLPKLVSLPAHVTKPYAGLFLLVRGLDNIGEAGGAKLARELAPAFFLLAWVARPLPWRPTRTARFDITPVSGGARGPHQRASTPDYSLVCWRADT